MDCSPTAPRPANWPASVRPCTTCPPTRPPPTSSPAICPSPMPTAFHPAKRTAHQPARYPSSFKPQLTDGARPSPRAPATSAWAKSFAAPRLHAVLQPQPVGLHHRRQPSPDRPPPCALSAGDQRQAIGRPETRLEATKPAAGQRARRAKQISGGPAHRRDLELNCRCRATQIA